jgi:DNA-binding NarL/FixJ family response regulator
MIRFILVEHRHIVRAGIKKLIEFVPGSKVVAEYEDTNVLLRKIKKPAADILITNLGPNQSKRLSSIKELKKTKTFLKIIVLTNCSHPDVIKESFTSGADAFLLKDCSENELYIAIEKVSNDENYCGKKVSEILLGKYINKHLHPRSIEISEREKEIIYLVSRGFNNKKIAEKLFLSSKTVDVHRAAILKKLNAKNAAEMVRIAMELKFVD